jgi:methyl-accepting chemotaxis protein
MGEPGRGFAYVAEDIRENAEGLRFAMPAIKDALDGTEAQDALLDELTDESGKVYEPGVQGNITAGTPEPAVTVGDVSTPDISGGNAGGFDPDAWEYEYVRIREQLEAIRDAVKSIGAALSENFDSGALDDKCMSVIEDNNKEISYQINTVKSILMNAQEKTG